MSECESIKHTLEIERTIDGGCDVLLDTDQKFIREGKVIAFFSSAYHFVRSPNVRFCIVLSFL